MASIKTSLLIVTFGLFMTAMAVAQTVTVDGHAFLEFAEVHDGIKVKFERLAPSYLKDSTYTDSSGYYSIPLESGIYQPTFTKMGYIGVDHAETPIYQNITLDDQTLEKSGLAGELTGQLASGIYKVDATAYVPANGSLTIEPGTTLKFKQDVVFEVYGELKAIGTLEDSIVFTRYADDIHWKGIDFKANSSDSSILKYCTVEYSDDRGISIYHCSPTISNTLIQKNNHRYITNGYEEDHGGGAGISLQFTNTNLDKVVIRENSGVTIGVGIYCKFSNTRISNSIISHNANPLAYDDYKPGGGIFCDSDNIMTIENTVISYNTSNLGGGICVGDNSISDSEVTIANCILYGNHVAGDYPKGGGIYTYNEPTLTVVNTLFWNNTLEDVNCDDPWLCVNVTVNNNLDSCDAYGNLTLDPQFASPETENYTLESGSPCIDAGINTMVTTETDFLHNHRIWDGNNDQDTIVDIGAYEYLSPANPVGISTHELQATNIMVYPNPAGEHINVNIQNISQVRIYDNSGRLILQTNQPSIDISDLNPGFYLLKVIDEEQRWYTGKVVKY